MTLAQRITMIGLLLSSFLFTMFLLSTTVFADEIEGIVTTSTDGGTCTPGGCQIPR